MDLLKKYLFINDPKNFKCSQQCVYTKEYETCVNCKDYEKCKEDNLDFCMYLEHDNTREENLKICKQCEYLKIGGQ